MSTTRSASERTTTATTWLAGALLAVGLALVGYGSSVHRTVGDRTLGHCDACQPWHPLFVLAPLGAGAALTVAGGALLARR